VPLTDALLNEFAPDRPLTAAEVESASRQFKKKPKSAGMTRFSHGPFMACRPVPSASPNRS
jgi:hypothetical protein